MDKAKNVWRLRLQKINHYLAQGNLQGLKAEVQQYMVWYWQTRWRRKLVGQRALSATGEGQNQFSEAEFWDQADIELIRHASWLNAGDGILGGWALAQVGQEFQNDMVALLLHTQGENRPAKLRGLVLGCGDMQAEHWIFIDERMPFAEIDAYDLSPASLERAKHWTTQKGLQVNYHVADLNELQLPANCYDVIICFYSYHHFTEVEAIAQQINGALKTTGVFFTIDYVGERQQQWSAQQLFFARQFLRLLPAHYRKELAGTLRATVEPLPVATFSPDEAIHSDLILPALAAELQIVRQYNWAGLLMPLLDGLGFNFGTKEEDLQLLKFLFEVDRALVQNGTIGPNFTITLAQKANREIK